MRKAVRLRPLSGAEEKAVRQLAASRKEAHRLVQRAKVIVAMLDEPKLYATDAGRQAGFANGQRGVNWVKRFNEEGLAGLEDKPRGGRPPVHDEGVRGALVELALQKPASLGLSFALWTLARLRREFAKRQGVALADSTIWHWLAAEGFAWKRQQSWFREVEKQDGEFVAKRGPSSPPILSPCRAPE